MASALIWAAPREGITMAWTPAHSAVRAIAPKFLTSVIRSKIRIRGVAENGLNSNRASFHIYNNKSEIDKLVEVIKNIA